LKENLGIVNVHSRLFEEPQPKKEVVIEEVKPAKKKDISKRGSSLAPMKSVSSTSNFNRTTKDEDSTESSLNQIYNIKPSS
jgi:hypothetical protein